MASLGDGVRTVQDFFRAVQGMVIMDRATRGLMQTAVLAPIIILTVAGCTSVQGPKMLGKTPKCDMVLGVDDCACHGHRKTCWRSWDQVCWQSQQCPQYLFTETASAHSPVAESPATESIGPDSVPPVPEM